VFQTAGWFDSDGLLFDCKYQYPLLIKKSRKDLDISFSSRKAFSNNNLVLLSDRAVYSVIWPFNQYFSHTFSSGISILPYIIQNLIAQNYNIYIPSKGPFELLLKSLNISKPHIIKSSSNTYVFSNLSTLILRDENFNILQAHWPSKALISLRNQTIKWLIRQNYIKPNEIKNLVLYLSRKGLSTRQVSNEEALISSIRKKLSSNYKLVILGGEISAQIKYGSKYETSNWIETSALFYRAVAVIGPHGGAFGNIYLCNHHNYF
jgi:hypothetical protein